MANSWDALLVRQALEKGAQGYVAKPDAFDELVPAIREIWTGKIYFSAQVAH